ncbi:MAG: hypothetical protein IJZ34_14515 [Lachnospiraceae bacterium]|nr:hypothetical protein [Lachnospiraceae bacterium]
MKNKYGYFINNGKEFYIIDPDIPRNWYNYFHNDHYVTFTSQVGTGEGLLQDDLGNRIKLVTQRAMYLADEKEFWSANALPVEDARDEYSCTHGLGYTVIHVKKNDVVSDYGMFVPNETDACTGAEVSWITVKNVSDCEKKLRIYAYTGTDVDEPYKLQGYNAYRAGYSEEVNGPLFHNVFPWKDLSGTENNRSFYAFMSCNEKPTHYECRRNGFIGTYGSVAYPKAAKLTELADSECVNEKFCFSLQNNIVLAPGEEKRLLYVCGISDSVEKLGGLSDRFLDKDRFDAEFADMQRKYTEIMDGVEVLTPYEELNYLCNHWLKYLTNMGSRWARVRHNGYRDIVSDTECLACFNPKLAWERLKRIMTYQYSNGYAPRTFLDGQIRDNNFADCTVWLTFTAYTTVMEIGDLALLKEEVPFNDGSKASVYEHLRRSVDYLYHFRGLHDLIRIWGGDWNDSINTAGLLGKGSSVWLTMAWYRANMQFMELAEKMNKAEDVAVCRERAEEIREIVDRSGWDEEGYYIYGYTDYDEKIGAHDSREGQIHLNTQLWAVLSQIAEDGKEITAIEAAERLLRRTDVGCQVLYPPYTGYDPHIGSITLKAPGTLENGGVYLHTIAWKMAVDGLLKRRDLMQKDLDSMLSFRNKVVDGKAEPYMLYNSYCAKEAGYRYGTPGQSWRTASGQWFLKAIVNYVYGLRPHPEGLEVDPCLPNEWDTCSIRKKFREAEYHITYFTNEGEESILVDGKAIEGKILPYEKNRCYEVVVYTK